MVADLILKNANVITMDPKLSTAEMVAIKGNRILLVADNRELDSVVGVGTKIIDCQGKTVVPGFIDSHCHIYGLIRQLSRGFDLSPASVNSIGQIKAHIKHYAQSAPAGKWLIGTGYDEFHLAEERHPTRWDIDASSSEHPLVLFHRSMHACMLNTLALQMLRITSETPEPPGGIIDHDADTGELNGLLYNMASYILKRIPPLSEEEIATGVALANKYYLSHGITSLQDA